MSANGLDVFDRTLQATHAWLDDIMAELGPDRRHAYHVLGAVLHALRDRLPVAEAAHLGAQLPLLVRGLYYEGWRPQAAPPRGRDRGAFLAHVEAGLGNARSTHVEEAIRAVLGTLSRHVSQGETAKVLDVLPAAVRALWPVA